MAENNSIIMDIADKHPNTILQISAGDLCDFAHQLLQTAMEVSRLQSKKAVENDLLTIDEVVALLKVSKMTLWRWSKSGRLKKVDIGGVPRYRRSDIEILLNNNDNASNTWKRRAGLTPSGTRD